MSSGCAHCGYKKVDSNLNYECPKCSHAFWQSKKVFLDHMKHLRNENSINTDGPIRQPEISNQSGKLQKPNPSTKKYFAIYIIGFCLMSILGLYLFFVYQRSSAETKQNQQLLQRQIDLQKRQLDLQSQQITDQKNAQSAAPTSATSNPTTTKSTCDTASKNDQIFVVKTNITNLEWQIDYANQRIAENNAELAKPGITNPQAYADSNTRNQSTIANSESIIKKYQTLLADLEKCKLMGKEQFEFYKVNSGYKK